MAFRKVNPETAAEMAAIAAKFAGTLGRRHGAAAAGLLKADEVPTDANTVLAAIKAWRSDQERHRLRWCNAALLQITSGDSPDDVCAGFGLGRTSLQQVVQAEESELASFTQFLYRARPTKAVA